MNDDGFGWKFWLWVIGVALAIGIGGMLLFILIGAAWYAARVYRLSAGNLNASSVNSSQIALWMPCGSRGPGGNRFMISR